MLLEELRSPTGKPYLSIHRPDRDPWIYADWTGYPTAANVSAGALAYLDRMKQERLTSVLNDNRHLVGRWDNSLDWLQRVWLPHAATCGLRHWAHLDNAGAMSVASATGLRQLIGNQFDVEIFSDQAAAENWLRARAAHR